ncbi:MAG: hypothetical protein EA381_20070 [Planctomycetaceae bacterium]|nr:MAG: hypothetical protein EA381_20070 [Planctomycetaceae bacterium]
MPIFDQPLPTVAGNLAFSDGIPVNDQFDSLGRFLRTEGRRVTPTVKIELPLEVGRKSLPTPTCSPLRQRKSVAPVTRGQKPPLSMRHQLFPFAVRSLFVVEMKSTAGTRLPSSPGTCRAKPMTNSLAPIRSNAGIRKSGRPSGPSNPFGTRHPIDELGQPERCSAFCHQDAAFAAGNGSIESRIRDSPAGSRLSSVSESFQASRP